MRVCIVGAGPTGLYLAIGLSRRGHDVTLIERDGGPDADGTWDRRGVMQFHHPHAFRHQVREALLAEMPDVFERLVAEGAEPVPIDGAPDGVAAVRCRRSTFERVLRDATLREPRVGLLNGHADQPLERHGRVCGVRVGDLTLDAELVVDASGRAGRFATGLRAAGVTADAGISYVSQLHELRPAAAPGPMEMAIGTAAFYRGYATIVFLHDRGTFSTLLIRASDDRELVGLRHPETFAAALRAIPLLETWTEPERSRPISAVMPGGRVYNSYRGQLDDAGRVALPGLLFVGDAVCTTNPSAGRGVSTSLLQAQRLLSLCDEHGTDWETLSRAFDAWCEALIRPWFEDHVYADERLIRRWAGADVDLSERLPSDLVVAATAVDPSMMRVVGPYLAMTALPRSLDAVQAPAMTIYARGWRPPVPQGPTRDEVAELVSARSRASTVTK
jgi:2-polyprenyl-6-methoxyphenol hydroxylase-like FAD-dependent oxidoreductase